MRPDAAGLWWFDEPEKRGKSERAMVMPPIPDTGWEAKPFPNLSTARVISIDVETYDPELLTHGPGWARGKGHLVGVSIGADNGGRWYFPMRHEIEPEHNMDPELVLRWLRDTLGNPLQPKVGANIMYDVGWLQEEGVHVAGDLYDVQYAEALLDERANVSLEHLAQRYLGEGKESNDLYEWCSRFYGGKANGKQRANIYRTPPRLTGPYAESDADLPLRIIEKQWGRLQDERLFDLFLMECGLIRLLIAMRCAGVRVDLERAEQFAHELEIRIKTEEVELYKLAGFEVNIDAAADLAKLFDKLGLDYGRTAKGAPSFTKPFLERVTHPVGPRILELRKLRKLLGTFIRGYVLDSHIDGKIYGQFHLLRSDDGGTRSGRFSSSTPNLQNIPSRDEELAPRVRGLFVPDYGHKQWRRYDYSQIEYRFLIHFAVGPGAVEAQQLFHLYPDTDYHEMTLDLVGPAAGWDISTPEKRKNLRKPIKGINFGLIYGMGIPKLVRSLGLSRSEGKALFEAYHNAVPFAKATMEDCELTVQRTGIITTILGRRSRFDLWGPVEFDPTAQALPYSEAFRTYGAHIERAHTHKALNRRLQGSAADLMKKAMWECWKAGVFDHTGVPRLTVHDELDFSDPGGADDAFAEMQHIMETAIPLKVPVKADVEFGPDWGHCK